jgi:glutamate racemase
MDKNSPIGIFDSGIGGLTVLKEVSLLLPSEDIIYLGDTAHLPYGTKSENVITRLAVSNILFLLEKGVKAVIVACNSTSSVSLPKIKDFFKVPVIGVVESGVEAALKRNKKKIGVIGTPATIRSKAYQNLIRSKSPQAEVLAGSCPLFVPLVEAGWLESSLTKQTAEIYLKKFKHKTDLLILGCTHYPLLKNTIESVLKDTELIDSAQTIAEKTVFLLKNNNLLKSKGKGRISFFLTDNTPYFSRLARLIINKKVKPRIIQNV